jgi:hypothetical protein
MGFLKRFREFRRVFHRMLRRGAMEWAGGLRGGRREGRGGGGWTDLVRWRPSGGRGLRGVEAVRHQQSGWVLLVALMDGRGAEEFGM